VQQFVEQPSAIYLAAGYPFNDNFMAASVKCFVEYFESMYTRCLRYPANANPIFTAGWIPESMMFQRFREMQPLVLVRSRHIPDF
jgi:hypothetical protein